MNKFALAIIAVAGVGAGAGIKKVGLEKTGHTLALNFDGEARTALTQPFLLASEGPGYGCADGASNVQAGWCGQPQSCNCVVRGLGATTNKDGASATVSGEVVCATLVQSRAGLAPAACETSVNIELYVNGQTRPLKTCGSASRCAFQAPIQNSYAYATTTDAYVEASFVPTRGAQPQKINQQGKVELVFTKAGGSRSDEMILNPDYKPGNGRFKYIPRQR